MRAKAIARDVRMSPRKARLVVDQIRGLPVNDAYALLQFSPKRAAEPVRKTLQSAVANAQSRADEGGESLDVDELFVTEAFVDEGPMLKRWKAAAMGRAMPRRRRMSHITLVVDNRE